MRGTIHLVDRVPVVTPADLLLDLVPPPRFSNARFSTYHPDSGEPSQARAVAALRGFSLAIAGASTITTPPRRRISRAGRTRKEPVGVYLDGGYGVGKSHLLAALCQTAGGQRSFGSFSEYVNLIDAIGGESVRERLAGNSLVCIDQCDLDDPDETATMASLMSDLIGSGVRLAVTSASAPPQFDVATNTSSDFRRTMPRVSRRFRIIKVSGRDYLRRDILPAPQPKSDHQVIEAATQLTASLDSGADLLAHLATIPRANYATLLNGLRTVCVLDLQQLEEQEAALRFAVFVDRLYDRNLAFVASGLPFNELFSDRLLSGQYRDRFFRTISRLSSLAPSS